jgi:hypothetical protein
MAVPTLAMTYEDLMKEISYEIGTGRAVPTDAGELADVKAVLERAIRRWLQPPIDQFGRLHRWSFLRPIYGFSTGVTDTIGGVSSTTITASGTPFLDEMVGATISVPTRDETAVITAVNSTSEIEIDAAFSAVVNGDAFEVYGYYQFRMPDNFSSLIAGPYFTTTQRPCDDIEVTSEGRIRSYRQHGQTTGTPRYAALRVVHDSGNQPTHYEMILHPPPDKIYSLSIQHAIAQDKPDYVNASSKYPPGASLYSEAISALCLAVVEEQYFPRNETRRVEWRNQLMTALQADRTKAANLNLGRMHDPGNWPSDDPELAGWVDGSVTYTSYTP